MTLSGFLTGLTVIGGAVAVGYAASSCAELSEEGRFWHDRLGKRKRRDEDDDEYDDDED